MAWRKRTFKRRATRRTRRTLVRRVLSAVTGTMDRRKLRTPMVHSFKRMIRDGSTWNGNAAYTPLAQAFSSANIQLANVVNSTDFANLYDQYRINYVVLKFWLRIDPSAQAAASASYPKLYWYL